MRIGDYLKNLESNFKSLFSEKKTLDPNNRVCIYLLSQEIFVIQLNQSLDTVEVLLTETLHYDSINNLPLVLTGFVTQHELNDVPIYWLLSPDEYQLFLIESLPVQANELAEALNWRIRSLLNYPIEQAVIDYFKFPPKKTNQTTTMIAGVTAKVTHLAKLTELFKSCGLNIAVIDVPELAMRNLTTLYETDEKSTAFIYFFDQIAILNITRQKTLYFTRRLNLLVENQTDRKEYEQVGLDVLRYFDYFQSQWRFPSPTRVFVGGIKTDLAAVAKSLSDYLLVAVEPYKLKNIVLDEKKLQLIESNYLLPFGCAMRKGESHVRTRD